MLGWLSNLFSPSQFERELGYQARIRALSAEVKRLTLANGQLDSGEDLLELVDFWREAYDASERQLALCRSRTQPYTEDELDEREQRILDRARELRRIKT